MTTFESVLPRYGDYVHRPEVVPAPAAELTSTPVALPAYGSSTTHHAPLVRPAIDVFGWHRQRAPQSVQAHQEARAQHDPESDNQRITDYLSTTRQMATEAVKSPWAFVPGGFVLRMGKRMLRRNQTHPEEITEFKSAIAHRVGALATRTGAWMVDELHDVDWWKLADRATGSPAIDALVTASTTAGPYGKAIKVAYEALNAAVAYHKAQESGHARLPAMFGMVASRELHRLLGGRGAKGRAAYEEGRASLEELLRRAATEQLQQHHAAA